MRPARWLQRFARPRQPEPLPVRLDRRRVYVLPTRSGLFFALLLAVMGLGALNYNNNPALLLALLLAGAAHSSLLYAHLQLSGLAVEAVAAEPVHAGQPLPLRIALAAGDGRVRRGLQLAVDGAPVVHAEVLPGRGGSALLRLPTRRRGLLALPRITLATVQPLALSRAWAYVWPAQSVLVYPTPEANPPPLPAAAGADGRARPQRSGDEPHHLRDYQPGDAPRTVAWKASARRGQLLVRQYEQAQARQLRLGWEMTAGLAHEQRIQRLAAWVEQAEREGRHYALELPGRAPIPAGHGPQQRHRCLRALALLPGAGDG